MSLALGIISALAAISASGVLQDAPEVPSTGIACVTDQTTLADRALLSNWSLNQPGPMPLELARRLRIYTSACVQRWQWNRETAEANLNAAMAVLVRDDMRELLARRRINYRLIEEWFASQSPALRASPTITHLAGATLEASLVRSGASEKALDDAATMIGQYVGALVIIERTQEGLPIIR